MAAVVGIVSRYGLSHAYQFLQIIHANSINLVVLLHFVYTVSMYTYSTLHAYLVCYAKVVSLCNIIYKSLLSNKTYYTKIWLLQISHVNIVPANCLVCIIYTHIFMFTALINQIHTVIYQLFKEKELSVCCLHFLYSDNDLTRVCIN